MSIVFQCFFCLSNMHHVLSLSICAISSSLWALVIALQCPLCCGKSVLNRTGVICHKVTEAVVVSQTNGSELADTAGRERVVTVLLLIWGLLSESCPPSGPVKLPQLFLFGREWDRGCYTFKAFNFNETHTTTWMQCCHTDSRHRQKLFAQKKDSVGPGLDISTEFMLQELRRYLNLHTHIQLQAVSVCGKGCTLRSAVHLFDFYLKGFECGRWKERAEEDEMNVI